MKTIRLATIGLALCSGVFAQDSVLARGKYLVESVARCQECHTVKGADGQPDKAKWLKGGPIDFKPVAENPKWHASAPDITSTSPLWQRWQVEGLIKFLETAKNPRGGGADAPMPAYQLSHDDSVAIVTYLKSLS